MRPGMCWNVLISCGRLRHRRKYNIKMDLEEMGLKVVDWIDRSQEGSGGLF